MCSRAFQSRICRVLFGFFVLYVLLYATIPWDYVTFDFIPKNVPANMVTQCSADEIDSNPGTHKLAIVVPMIVQQVDRLKFALQSWKKFAPCTTPKTCTKNIDVLFYFDLSLDNPEVQAAIEKIKSDVAEKKLSDLFGDIKFVSAEMSPDDSVNTGKMDIIHTAPSTHGINVQFYKLLIERSDLVRDYRFIFWMEADAVPVQAGWAQAIYEETVGPRRPFWMRGSILRYNRPYVLSWKPFRDQYDFHLNGNSIYRNDPCFREYLRVVREEYGDIPFDLSILYWRYARKNFKTLQKIIHRFEYSTTLIDVGSHEMPEKNLTNVYIVHGKQQFYQSQTNPETSKN